MPNQRKIPYVIKLSNRLSEAISEVRKLRDSKQLSDNRIVQIKLRCGKLKINLDILKIKNKIK